MHPNCFLDETFYTYLIVEIWSTSVDGRVGEVGVLGIDDERRRDEVIGRSKHRLTCSEVSSTVVFVI